MNEILFRCSGLGQIMTESKTKSDPLGITCKTYIEKMWYKNQFGFEEIVQTDAMLKGLLCEQDSMDLVQYVLGGEFRTAYGKREANEYICGTPDIVLSDCIEDIKTCQNLRTFMESDLDKDYFAQGQGYMELKKVNKYRLIYCLIPTPENIIAKELAKLEWQFRGDFDNPDFVRMYEQTKRNNECINDIPKENRIKVFEFDYDVEFIAKLYSKIELCREYYNTLKLPNYPRAQ